MHAFAKVQQRWGEKEKEEEEEEEWSRLERRENQMSSWNDVLHGPRLRIPKYLVLEMWTPGARRTPFPREAPLVSLARETAGSSGVQTSAKRQAREICTHCASFFPFPGFPPTLFLPHSLPPFFSSFVLCFQTPLFHQINIAQNKRQDNFKLVREERRERRRGRIWFGLRAPCEVSSLSSRSSHSEVCGFCHLRRGVSSI